VGRHKTTSPSGRGGGGEARAGRGGVYGRILHAGGEEVEERQAATDVGGGRGGDRAADVGRMKAARTGVAAVTRRSVEGTTARGRRRRLCVCACVWCVCGECSLWSTEVCGACVKCAHVRQTSGAMKPLM
jgi:hypothetical protein